MSVKVHINSEETSTSPGPSVFECAETVGVRVPTSCRKQGKCRECLVEVVEGMSCLSPPTEEEKHLKENFRLSCRARIVAREGVIRCHTLRRGAMRIEERAVSLPNSPCPLKLDPAVSRDGDRVFLDDEVIATSSDPLYGISVDLGTTTVVMRLVNLETGNIAATHSFENPQRFAGSDVMARIGFDSENKGKLLQRTLIGYMTHAIEAFPCNPQSVYEMTIAGNSTMRDLFFGLDVYGIGQKPYRSLTEYEFLEGKSATTSLSLKARRLRLPIHPEARVYGLPLIGSHVGADAAACALATGLPWEDRTVALMDIGTNTELVVGNRDRILAASCPAGPAFEGGGLSCGMPGLEGAIESVTIGNGGQVQFRVIGDKAPEGICGSGLVELLGNLLRTGHMNTLGRFVDGCTRFMVDEGEGVYLAENDISLLAQAKGANVAGLYIVLNTFGIDFQHLDSFYVAGGFGRHLNLEAARHIGLIPNLPGEKIIQIGNASIEGATLALISLSLREELESFVKKIQHVELEQDPNFFDYFVEGCQFIPIETTSCKM